MNGSAWFTQLLPEWILLIGGCLVLFLGATRSARSSNQLPFISLVVVLAALVVSVLRPVEGLATTAAPGLLLTELTNYVRFVALGVGLLLALVNWHQPISSERGEYLAMMLFSLLGVLLTASANDLLVLFFAIELVSVPTYVLIGLSRDDSRAPESTVKYFFLGAMAAAVLAYGLSFLYGVAGTTTMYVVRDGTLQSTLALGAGMDGLALIGLLLVFGGLCFKIAAVPFHFYAPDVYEGAASPVTGLLGFVPKIAGFVALLKIFGAMDWALPTSFLWIVWLVAAASMTFGNVQALLQQNAKRVLAYSSIAHSGYMLIALLVGPLAGAGPMRDGVLALLFYIGIYGAMNLGVFALLASYQRDAKSIELIDEFKGLAAKAPIAALALAACLFSLMGFPPTAGLLGKLYIFSSAFSLDQSHAFHGPLVALAIIGLLNSAIAAAYYLRLVAAAYMQSNDPDSAPVPKEGMGARLGLVCCAVAMIGLFVSPMSLVRRAKPVDVVLTGNEVSTVLTAAPEDSSAVVLAKPLDSESASSR